MKSRFFKTFFASISHQTLTSYKLFRLNGDRSKQNLSVSEIKFMYYVLRNLHLIYIFKPKFVISSTPFLYHALQYDIIIIFIVLGLSIRHVKWTSKISSLRIFRQKYQGDDSYNHRLVRPNKVRITMPISCPF